tara:strand:- start:13983 stop:14267 length:285 start_codon:yes stop_codon:yes gene_type:complete
VPRFFGLTPSDKEIFLQQIFLLMYYMGFTYTEAYHLPVWQRIWFINRTNEEIKESAKANDGQAQSRAAHMNHPEARSMMNRARSQVPARLRRFT